jgi:peptide deformylase
MALAIAQLGQPVLRRVAEPVPPEVIGAPEFQHFLDEMLETLRRAGGVGLAAPQLFVSRRVFLAVLQPPGEAEDLPPPEVLINPRLVGASEDRVPGWEGCLSFPELQVLVARARCVRVEYLNRQGEPRGADLEGFPARVVQHEYDHLDGVLTLDRAASTRDIVKTSELEDVCRYRELGGD